MPSRAWHFANGEMLHSDAAGLAALQLLKKKTADCQEGPWEMITGHTDGVTLMHVAAYHGRVQCSEYLLSNGASSYLHGQSGSRRTAADYAKNMERDVYDPHNPLAPPTRPHNKIYNNLRLSMGEYVEKDMARGTPGLSNWQAINHKWNDVGDYQIPWQWKPDRPYYPVRDRNRVRKRPAHLDE